MVLGSRVSGILVTPKEQDWLHISYRIMVYGTSNGPQHDIGNSVGPCGMLDF